MTLDVRKNLGSFVATVLERIMDAAWRKTLLRGSSSGHHAKLIMLITKPLVMMLWSLTQTIDSSVHSFFDDENKVPVATISTVT